MQNAVGSSMTVVVPEATCMLQQIRRTPILAEARAPWLRAPFGTPSESPPLAWPLAWSPCMPTGDMHFSQGDGEVSFCGAIEMSGFLELKWVLMGTARGSRLYVGGGGGDVAAVCRYRGSRGDGRTCSNLVTSHTYAIHFPSCMDLKYRYTATTGEVKPRHSIPGVTCVTHTHHRHAAPAPGARSSAAAWSSTSRPWAPPSCTSTLSSR